MPEVLNKREVSIHPSRMRLAEYDRQEWTVNAELGTSLEDVLLPSYWAHMAEQMKQYDHIEVRIDDGSWVAFLLVTSCDRTWAKVKMLSKIDLDDDMSTPITSKLHEVKWRGPQLKFSVIRLSDNKVIKEGIGDKLEAYRWMQEYERTK